MKKIIKMNLGLLFAFVLSVTTLTLLIINSPTIVLSATSSEPKTTVSKLTMYVNTKTYVIKFENLKNNASVSFQSSNTKIVKVSDAGIITPREKGTATITVTMKQDSRKYTSKIKVTVDYPNIKIIAKSNNLNVGDEYTFKAKAYGTMNSDIIWSVSDKSLAEINSKSGRLKAISDGEVEVIATAGSITRSFTVTISKKDESISPRYSGNTNGNIINGGEVVQQDEWVYYRLFTSSDCGIYKMKSDGTQKNKISSSLVFHMAIEGDWIYYDEYEEIYKMKTDGSNVTKLAVYQGLIDDINVVDGWIYYTNIIVLNESQSAMYRLSTDGSDKEQLSTGYCWDLTVYDNWIYYSKSDKIYKMNTDGSQNICINDDRVCYMNVVDGWIYYSKVSDNRHLWKMKTDGSEKTRLNQEKSNHINVFGDWIYFEHDDVNEIHHIFKMKIDGSGRTKVKESSSLNAIYLVNGELFDIDDWD